MNDTVFWCRFFIAKNFDDADQGTGDSGYSQQLSYAMKPFGREAWMKGGTTEGRLTVRHHPPRQPDRSEREAAAAPTKECSEAERRGGGKDDTLPASLCAKLKSRSEAEATIDKWLAGRQVADTLRSCGGCMLPAFLSCGLQYRHRAAE